MPEINQITEYLKQELSGTNILEIATGTGYWTRELAPVVKSILATDINTEVLDLAKEKCQGFSSVQFQIADIYSLDNVEGSFDAGLAGYIWSHVLKENLDSFLDTFHSKLDKGAKVVFIDNNYVPGESTLIYDQDYNGNTYQKRKLKDGSEHLVLKNFPTGEEVGQYLEGKATDIEFISRKYYWILSYRYSG